MTLCGDWVCMAPPSGKSLFGMFHISTSVGQKLYSSGQPEPVEFSFFLKCSYSKKQKRTAEIRTSSRGIVLVNNSNKKVKPFCIIALFVYGPHYDDSYGFVAVCVTGWADVALVLLQGSPRVSSCKKSFSLPAFGIL